MNVPQGALASQDWRHRLRTAPPHELLPLVQRWSRSAHAAGFAPPPVDRSGLWGQTWHALRTGWGLARSAATLDTDTLSHGPAPTVTGDPPASAATLQTDRAGTAAIHEVGTMLHALIANPFWDQIPEHRDWDRILDLLVRSPAVMTTRNDQGYPLLFSLLMFGRTAYLDRLLDRGILATMALPTRDGRTPLHLVSRNGPTDLVQRFLDAGAPVNAQDEDGDTPLMMAVTSGEVLVMQRLLAAGADPTLANTPGNAGNTALHLAAEKCQLAAMRCLLDTGLDLNLRNAHGDTALDLVQRRLPPPGEPTDPAWDDPHGCLALLHATRVARERAVLETVLPTANRPTVATDVEPTRAVAHPSGRRRL